MADLFCSDPFTPTDKLKALERELGYRRRVYQRLVDGGKMKPETMKHEIGVFEAMANDYRRQPRGGYMFGVHVPIAAMIMQVRAFVAEEVAKRWPAANIQVGPHFEPDNHHNAAACPYCLNDRP